MERVIRRATAAMILCASIPTAAEEAPVDLSGSGVRGRLARIVKPDYPWAAFQRRITGEVTMEGVIRPDGFVDEFKYIPDKPESAVFLEALKAVAPNWIFRPPHDNECKPTTEPVRVKVSFEIDNGEPRIFVTHESAPKGPSGEPLAHYRPVKRVDPDYPSILERMGVSADTYAKVTVDREGNVSSLKTYSYARRRQRQPDVSAFDAAVERALSQWKFSPVPPEHKAPWIGCYHINFRIRD